jgi:putative ABC transport system permease protein
MQGALVVSEIALASVLIVGAGLLIRSFGHLLETEGGFNPERLLSLQLSLSQANYSKPAQRDLFVRRALEEINRQPGIVSAGVVSRRPLNPGNSTRGLTIRAVRHPLRSTEASTIAWSARITFRPWVSRC